MKGFNRNKRMLNTGAVVFYTRQSTVLVLVVTLVMSDLPIEISKRNKAIWSIMATYHPTVLATQNNLLPFLLPPQSATPHFPPHPLPLFLAAPPSLRFLWLDSWQTFRGIKSGSVGRYKGRGVHDVVLRDREAREVVGGVVLVGSPVRQLAMR